MNSYVGLCFIWFSLFSAIYAEDSSYSLGHGIRVGNTPLYAGGYFSLEYENVISGVEEVKLEDLSLMLYGETERYNYMMELESNDLYSEVLNGSDDNESIHFNLHIERFYFDTKYENFTIRVGKFNSLIGLWNRIPINIFRDTTSNPKVVQYLFPRFTSGMNVDYHPQKWNDTILNIMLQKSKDFDAYVNDTTYNNLEINRHYGVGIETRYGGISYNFNVGMFRFLDGQTRYYLESAFSYEDVCFRLQGEIGMQFDKENATIPYIGYLQGVYRIAEEHEVVFRVESYDDKDRGIEETFGVLGYIWRPVYPVSLKGEYQVHQQNSANRLLFSVSMMF